MNKSVEHFQVMTYSTDVNSVYSKAEVRRYKLMNNYPARIYTLALTGHVSLLEKMCFAHKNYLNSSNVQCSLPLSIPLHLSQVSAAAFSAGGFLGRADVEKR